MIDLKVVKDIHAKALLSAYHSNCPTFIKVAKEKKRLYIGWCSYTNWGGGRHNTFKMCLMKEGSKKGHKHPQSATFTTSNAFMSPYIHSVESLLLYRSCHLIL